MKCKAVQNFSGITLSAIINQEVDITDMSLANDLIHAGFVVPLEPISTEEDSNKEVCKEKQQENEITHTSVEEPVKTDVTSEEKTEDTTNESGSDAPSNDDNEGNEDNDVMTADDFKDKKVSELKEICRSLGIPAEGNKDQIIESILKEYND